MTRTTFFFVLAELLVVSACIDTPDAIDDPSEEEAAEENAEVSAARQVGRGKGNGKRPDAGTQPDTEPEPEPEPEPVPDPNPVPISNGVMLSTSCPAYSGVYTPFVNYGPVSTGTVATYPWVGPTTSYPDSLEDFRGYGPTLPTTVECSNNKSLRNYLDVTSGCLSAVAFSGGKSGKLQMSGNGGYRSFALPYDAVNKRQVAWKDQGVEYRFFYSSWSAEGVNPGFKAFVRYLTEYDLYVASWRKDGVVQIQKKQCGAYTTLKRITGFGAPTPNVWHTIRFDIKGTQKRLYLDGALVMTTSDSSITTGTAGIRTDATEAAYIDDWRVYAP
jgi:hypothetical protein